MRGTWQSDSLPQPPGVSVASVGRVILRSAVLVPLLVFCLALMGILRLFERPFFGEKRPLTPYITVFFCRSALRVMGIGFRVTGRTRTPRQLAVVANHSSWLDILALNGAQRIYFVSKSEVASWPGIGLLARVTGTVFIRRQARDTRSQLQVFEQRLGAGHRLLFFPEGTSTDGMRVLPFNSTLFASFFTDKLRENLSLVPVTVAYTVPPGADPRFYGWWGEMDLAPHLLTVLGCRRQGRVDVIYHAPVRVADFDDRKALAKHCENEIRAGLPAGFSGMQPSGPATQ